MRLYVSYKGRSLIFSTTGEKRGQHRNIDSRFDLYDGNEAKVATISSVAQLPPETQSTHSGKYMHIGYWKPTSFLTHWLL